MQCGTNLNDASHWCSDCGPDQGPSWAGNLEFYSSLRGYSCQTSWVGKHLLFGQWSQGGRGPLISSHMDIHSVHLYVRLYLHIYVPPPAGMWWDERALVPLGLMPHLKPLITPCTKMGNREPMTIITHCYSRVRQSSGSWWILRCFAYPKCLTAKQSKQYSLDLC